MPIDPTPQSLSDSVLQPQDHHDVTTVVDDGVGQSYLNADERAGANINGKESFTIDRAGLQLTGFVPETMQPQPGWGGTAGQSFTVTYAFRATAPTRMPSDTDGF